MSDPQDQSTPEFVPSGEDLSEWFERFADELDKVWQRIKEEDSDAT